MLVGGCFCGAVRYAAGPALYPPTYCHCTSCRRASGSHAVAWYTIARADLHYLGAALVERESSIGVFRGYCAQCYSPLIYRCLARPGEMDLTIASLDQPDLVVPVDHIHMADALDWDRPMDGLPQYQRTRLSD
jgi:hypothetical protein